MARIRNCEIEMPITGKRQVRDLVRSSVLHYTSCIISCEIEVLIKGKRQVGERHFKTRGTQSWKSVNPANPGSDKRACLHED